MNSRRPGRFEVRLGASRKKSLILYKIFLLSLVQVGWPPDANYLPIFCSFLSCVASSPFLCKSCKSCNLKKTKKNKSICGAEVIKTDFFSSALQIKAHAPLLTSTSGFAAQRLQSFQQRHDDCCRKCQALFFPPLLKPGYSNLQIKVNNRSYA